MRKSPLDLLDTVLAHAVESVWTNEPMRRDLVAVWHYDEERLTAAAAGETFPALDLLRDVLDHARDSVTTKGAMDGEQVDRWRAAAVDLRTVAV